MLRLYNTRGDNEDNDGNDGNGGDDGNGMRYDMGHVSDKAGNGNNDEID